MEDVVWHGDAPKSKLLDLTNYTFDSGFLPVARIVDEECDGDTCYEFNNEPPDYGSLP